MKSFYLSIALFFIMLFGIVGNYFYVNGVADDMEKQIDALPAITDPTCLAAATELSDFWLQQADTVSLSVSYTVVDRVSEQAALLISCAACDDVFGYRAAITLLRDAVGDMRRSERFSIGNLL